MMSSPPQVQWRVKSRTHPKHSLCMPVAFSAGVFISSCAVCALLAANFDLGTRTLSVTQVRKARDVPA